MKKVLFFLESLKGGGAEKVLLDIVRNLPRNKYYIKVLVVTDNGIYDEEIKKYCSYESILNIDQYRSNFMKRMFYSIKYRFIYMCPSKWIYKRYIGNEWDIIVGFVEGFATRIVSCTNNNLIKKVAWVHVDPIERPYADEYFRSDEEQKKVYKSFNQIVCVSYSVAKSFKIKWGIAENVITIYNPIDRVSILKKSKEQIELKKLWKIQFVSSGRLVSQKGFDRLIRVMKRIKDFNDFDFGLIILGEGEDYEKLLSQIEYYHLEKNIKLLGFQRNPYPYVAISDIFICSSRAEGYSLVIAEAMVLGLGIISTNCSGPNELLNNGHYGLLVENNEDALFKAIQFVLNNPSLITEFQLKARKRGQCFNIENACKEIQEKVL